MHMLIRQGSALVHAKHGDKNCWGKEPQMVYLQAVVTVYAPKPTVDLRLKGGGNTFGD